MIRLSDIPPEHRKELATAFAKTGAIKGAATAEHALVAMYLADAHGFGVGATPRVAQFAKGPPDLTADALAALIMQHPRHARTVVEERSKDRCVVVSTTRDGVEYRAIATLDDAKARGLFPRPGQDGKYRDSKGQEYVPTWVGYTARMLHITAMREIADVLYPDIMGAGGGGEYEDTPTPAEHAQVDASAAADPPPATPLERAQARVAEVTPEPPPAPARTFRDALADAEGHEAWRAWRTSLPPSEADHLRTFLRGLGDEDRADVTAATDPGAALLYLAQSAGIGQTAPAPALTLTKRTAKEVANVVRHLGTAGILTDEETSALLTPGVIPRSGLDLADDDTADAATLRALLPTGDPR